MIRAFDDVTAAYKAEVRELEEENRRLQREVSALKAGLLPKATLVITMDGGVIQAISSPTPDVFENITIMTVDYDTDGGDPQDVSLVPQEPLRSAGGDSPSPPARAFVFDAGGVDQLHYDLIDIKAYVSETPDDV